jgi:hypothetical protein
MNKKLKIHCLIPWLLAIIPILLHIVVLKSQAMNFPFEDDHRVFMDFFYNYLNASGFREKTLVLLTPDNESRPFLIRLSLLIPLQIFRSIDFKIILYFVNLYTVLLVWVFYKRYKHFPVFLVLLSFLLLSHCNWELFFRNDVASYQLATVSFSVLLFYLISKKNSLVDMTSRLVFYVGLFIVPFGSALGFITVFFVLLYVFLRKKQSHSYIILSVFVLQMIIYLSSGVGGSSSINIINNLLKYNFELVGAFFIAIGGQFRFVYTNLGFLISGFFGLITFVFSSYLLLKNWRSEIYDFEKLIYLFGVASLGIIVVSRYNYWIVGYESVLGPRYKIYGILIFLSGISFVYNAKMYKKTQWMVSAIFIVFYIGWFFKSSDYLILKNETLMMDAYNLENDMIKNERQNVAFEAKYKYDYLKRNGFFDANELYGTVLGKIKNSVIALPTTAVLTQVSFDPAFESDWGGKEGKLNKISLIGDFPVSCSYFIRLTDAKNKSIILNGLRKPLSIIKRIFLKEKPIDFLSKEFEMSHLKLQKPLRCEVICVQQNSN